MEPSFTRADPLDAPELARIAAASFPDPWTEGSFRIELGRGDCEALVARAGGRIGAYVLGRRLADAVDIVSVAVDRPLRGQGLGRRLLEAYLEGLRRRAVRRVNLEVRLSNAPARALYRRLGMRPEGERRRFYPGGETALLYGAEL